jgi:hypothetical protein
MNPNEKQEEEKTFVNKNAQSTKKYMIGNMDEDNITTKTEVNLQKESFLRQTALFLKKKVACEQGSLYLSVFVFY